MNVKNLWYRLLAAERSFVRGWRRRIPPGDVALDLNDATIAFVIASPRSGTTWLQRALNEHPQITCGENRLFGSFFDVVKDSETRRLRITLDEYASTLAKRTVKQDLAFCVEDYAEELTAAFAQTAFEKWRQHSGKSILVDKVTPYPGTSDQVVQKIRKYFPQAHIIQLVRDGRDVLTSGVFHWLQKSTEGTSPSQFEKHRHSMIVGGQPLQPISRFFTDEEIRLWSQTWSEPVDAVEKFLPADNLQIRYEDMIADQSQVLRQICDRVGADASASVLHSCVKYSSFLRMSGGRASGMVDPGAHVRKGIVGDWENYFTRHDGELFQTLCGRQLLRLGYVSDANWPESLPASLQLQKAS